MTKYGKRKKWPRFASFRCCLLYIFMKNCSMLLLFPFTVIFCFSTQINFAQPATVLHNFIRGNDKVSRSFISPVIHVILHCI